MPHFAEEQFSAYIDNQLDANETRALERHVSGCESCKAILGQMRELTNLFREAERLEPSPFLWNRIAAGFEEEYSRKTGWAESVAAFLRHHGWSPRMAAGVLAILVFTGVALFREINVNIADRAALAEIDRAYSSLAAQDPEAYNPFSSDSYSDFNANPFRNTRLNGTRDSGAALKVQRH